MRPVANEPMPSVRLAAAIALVALCSSAQAADPWTPFRKMFPGKAPPVVVEPLPPAPPPQDDAQAAIERALAEAEERAARAEEAAAKAEEALRAAIPDAKSPVVMPVPKPKPRARAPLQLQPSLPGDADYISCEEARQGVTMSCEKLKRWAWVYNGYSERKKANSQACLTASERKRIADCFR